MDGPHDLGGKEGYGSVKTDEDEANFKSDWEARMWSINCAMAQDPRWTLDWWRHVRELIAPTDYLTRPYFDQWHQIYSALLIDSGHATIEELVSGRSDGSRPDLGQPMVAKEVAEAHSHETFYDREIEAPPAFAVGDRVLTKSQGQSGHTRLPAYARGQVGIVHTHHGAHLLPDEGARGREAPEHLYSVCFFASDLWPEAAERQDRVFLDLWESYLER